MIYLAGQIFICLLLVMAIGFLMGWLLRSVGIVRQFTEVEATWKMRLRQKDEMLAKMYAETEEKERQFSAMLEGADGGSGENIALKSKLHDANRALADLELKLSSKERDLQQAQSASVSKSEPDSGELRSQLALLRGAATKKDNEIARLRKRLEGAEQSAVQASVANSTVESNPEPKPQSASAPQSEGEANDELRNIFGIGPVLEKRLNAEGITSFRQVAAFTSVEIERVAEAIGCFADRIVKDDWMESARQEHLRKYGEQI